MIIMFNPDTGVVTQVSGETNKEFEAQLTEQGVSFIVLGTDVSALYVDVTVDPPCVRGRPVLTGAFTKSTVPAEEETSYPDLPPGPVIITGPEGSMNIEHEGGDLDLLFVIPGEYRVITNLFPYQYREFAIKVTNGPVEDGE